MLTVRDVTEGFDDLDETALIKISDRLWALGGLEQIRENVSTDLFYLHIGMNLIGNWKGGGWWYLICEQADFIPYIPETLDRLGQAEIKEAFLDVLAQFPKDTVFQSDNTNYYDICNFMQSPAIKVNDERLKSIPPEKRREMVRGMKKKLDDLENLTEQFWADSSEGKGFRSVSDYIIRNR